MDIHMIDSNVRPARWSGRLYIGLLYCGHPKFSNFWLQKLLGILSGREWGRGYRRTYLRTKAAYLWSVNDELCLATVTKNRRAACLISRVRTLTRYIAGRCHRCSERSVHGEHGWGPLPMRKIRGSKEAVANGICCLWQNTFWLLRFRISGRTTVSSAKFGAELGLAVTSSRKRGCAWLRCLMFESMTCSITSTKICPAVVFVARSEALISITFSPTSQCYYNRFETCTCDVRDEYGMGS